MNYQRESSVHKDSYRGDQVLGRAEWFLDVLNRVNGNRDGRNLLWKAAASAPVGFCHITSGVLGKLLEGIMDGLNLDRIQRRFARLEEIETLWKAPAPADHEGGVFAGVPTRTAKPKSDDLTPRVNMTWVKFRDTVLPRATKIEFQVRQGKGQFLCHRYRGGSRCAAHHPVGQPAAAQSFQPLCLQRGIYARSLGADARIL